MMQFFPRRPVEMALVTFLAIASLSAEASYQYDARRGHPAEYDPGPEKNSSWAKLFAENPNYRAYGHEALGTSKFRWIFGPMWYRGRLGENQVKVFVVGQEGAQDENISNRAFTGSTGTKTQKLLNHFGIYESYLFLNTFTYTIKGQLEHDDEKFKWLEQGLDPEQHTLRDDQVGSSSPIVEYRHRLFDNMARTNRKSLNLLIGVGSGGKASLATWVRSHGGNCSPSGNMSSCDLTAVEKKFGIAAGQLLAVGVPHPGGASPRNGGPKALKNIVKGFTSAARQAARKMTREKGWLEPDRNPQNGRRDTEASILARLNQTYRYTDAPIPFRDFAFGTNWRMGAHGTTSNRKDKVFEGNASIQVFSDVGKYNGEGDEPRYGKAPQDILAAKPRMPDGDLPYESPKYFEGRKVNLNREYDYGPCSYSDWNGWRSGRDSRSVCPMAYALQSWEEEGLDLGVSHSSFGFGPAYRGNLYNAKILILADQKSHDDFFSGRALTGSAGQELQGMLNAIGADGSYAIIRTLPVDTLGSAQAEELALSPGAINARERIFEEILKQRRTEVLLTFGSIAARAAKASSVLENLKTIDIDQLSWEDAAYQVAKAAGLKKTGSVSMAAIPREDLPSHTRWWMGSSGSRGQRADSFGSREDKTGSYYKVFAPEWVYKSRYKPLTQEEKKLLDWKMAEYGIGVQGRSGPADPVSKFLSEGGDEGDYYTVVDEKKGTLKIRITSQDDYQDYDFDQLWKKIEESVRITGRSTGQLDDATVLSMVDDHYEDYVLSSKPARDKDD